MRTLIMLTGIFLLCLNSFAQNTKGRIVYKEMMNMEMDTVINNTLNDTLAAEHMEGINEILEQFSIPDIQRELLFTSKSTSFKIITKSKNEQMTSEDGSQAFHFVMMVPEEELFIDLENKEAIEQKEFMDKKFLLNYSIEKQDWKITGKQKTIAEKLCFQALLQNDTNQTTAWFCPEIPVAGGPDIYGQLPGLILELTTNKGKLTYQAVEINLDMENTTEIKAPKKGKKVSREEYSQIVEEKTKEMKEVNGGQMVIEIKSF